MEGFVARPRSMSRGFHGVNLAVMVADKPLCFIHFVFLQIEPRWKSLCLRIVLFFQFKGSMSLPFVKLSGRFCERNREKDFVSLFLSVRLNFKEIGCVIARCYSRPVKASTFGSWRKLHCEKIFKWTYSCTHTRCCSFSPYRYVKLMR